MANISDRGKSRVGHLPPRYSFALNPYEDARFSKCPQCERATYPRKFPLLIHVDGFGAVILGKTCKYCSRCEFIITHQDELEHELTNLFLERAPAVIGNEYFVIGTVEKKTWRANLGNEGSIADILSHTADIKTYMRVMHEPGGWGPQGEGDS